MMQGRQASRSAVPHAQVAAVSAGAGRGLVRLVLVLVSLAIFAGLCTALAQQVWRWLDKPVTEVRVLGDARHLNKAELAQRLAAGLNAPLLQLDLSRVQERLLEEPWVRGAKVRRDWPPAIEVRIDEEVPVARWGDKGLLNHEGDIFWPELKPEYAALPRLNGPASDTGRVMAQFHDLNRMFQSAGLNLSGLSLEARGAWTLELDNGMRVVVGRERVTERLARFIQVYRQGLAEHAAQIEQVDIRYTNGVAVKWRPKPDTDEKAG
ncbi:cell division protein FtsQ/DivIB [Marinobacterium sedimentorum]|uniref:cell division protein FtsQ/DivIB n=1 Tax=Marinobacterium sedimentorum TaxID=2927804 RepID=UPI0020C6C344|nr:cell division protein FtsQ/DivIB [Marinobacterium sedimentorum]MCP8689574.1 cell division protein FtsQ/DivIB [Marinobacterium sedimentorum]